MRRCGISSWSSRWLQPFSTMVIVIICCCCTFAATHHQCQLRPTNFEGWKAEELSNDWVRLAIVPQFGGRLMQVTFACHSYLFVNPEYKGQYFPPSEKNNGKWQTSSPPSTVTSETLRTSTISLSITAVRSRVSRVRPVGISAPVLAASTARLESKGARFSGTRISTTSHLF